MEHPVDRATLCHGYIVLGKTILVLTTFFSDPGAIAHAKDPSSSVALDPTEISSGLQLNSCAVKWCNGSKALASAISSKLLLPFSERSFI